jgi:hypothetical protein
MRNLIIMLLAGIAGSARAQPVAKTVLAEHFTNKYCSICASKNPPLYNNMSMHAGVLHIAYHPSSPYPACPLNMHNVSENDGRANYYGVYGGTPKLVMQGVPLPTSTSYADPAIFTSVAGQTTPFSMRVEIVASGSDSVKTTVWVKKEDASTLTTLNLYGALVEDTIFVASANGEPGSYDVFRKAVWGTNPVSVAAPISIGDSVMYTGTVARRTEWAAARMYALAIVQADDKQLVQAARSGYLQPATGMPAVVTATLSLAPNPATGYIKVSGLVSFPVNVTIFDAVGRRQRDAVIEKPDAMIPVSDLPVGSYFLHLQQSAVTLPFTRE